MADPVSILVGTAIFLSAPMVFAFLGVMWAELSGDWIFGMEGIMLLGGISAFITALFTGNILIGFFAGLAVGLILGALTAFFEVSLGADQVIFAISLLVLGPSLSSFLFQTFVAGKILTLPTLSINTLPYIAIPYISSIPLIGPFFDQPIIIYIMYAIVIVTHYFFFHTKSGLRLRAVGMNPHASDAMGINVTRMKYIGLVMAGIMGALGGITIVLAQTGFWSDNITAGRGLIAIALVRVGNWKTQLCFMASIGVGGLMALGADLQSLFTTGGATGSTGVPYEAFSMIPYIVAVAIIAISYKWSSSNEPAAYGKPFRRE